MKTLIHFLVFSLLFFATSYGADPTANQWFFQKKNAGAGFSNFGVTGTNSQAFGLDGSGVPTMLAVGTGTVTSVGVSMPSAVFDVASSPVTTTGTIAITFDTQTANLVFAGPSSGGAAAPTFRSLVASDIPSLTSLYATTAQGVKADNVGAVNGLIKSNGSASFSAATAGTDYLTPSGNGSALTALNATQLTSGTVPTARLGSGTANSTTFLRGDNTWQTVSSGGGGASPGDEVAYVYPETGNNTTGDGTASAPWATIQKAVDEGKTIIILGEGNAGSISVSTDIFITIIGLGKSVSFVSGVSATGVDGDITIYDGGHWTFAVTGNIISFPSSAGEPSGDIVLRQVYAAGNDVNSQGSIGGSTGQQGGNAGNIDLEDCYVASVSAGGGQGASGDCSTLSGNGGNGGNVNLLRTWVSATVNGTGGQPGSDGGGGSGSPGADGICDVYWCDLQNSPGNFGFITVHASIVSGAWTD